MGHDGVRPAWPQAVPSRGERARQYGSEMTSRGFDLSSFWRLLVRRHRLIIVTVIVVAGCSTAAILTLSPRYNAEALLLVREHQPTLLDIQNAVRGNEPETSDSEIEIIRSRRIAKLVVKKLDLIREPSINPELQPEGLFDRLRREAATALEPAVARVTAWLPKAATSTRPVPKSTRISLPKPSEEDMAMTRTADALVKNLTVAAKGRSRAVGVRFESTDPQLSAAVANAVVDSYVADQLDAKLLASAQANEWLSQRVAEIREQVIDTDRQLQQHKVDAGMTDGRQVGLIQEQISGLSEQMIAAHAQELQAQARLQQAQQTRTAGALSEILNSPVIQKLREDQANLQSKFIAARALYGDKYPPVMKLQAELTDLNASIQHEVGNIVGALRNDVAALHSREELLRSSLDDLKAQSARIGATDVDISVQQRESDANRALFDRILSRAKETNAESGLQRADAEVIAHADVPEKASFPNKPVFMAVAVLAALAAAGLIVVAVESLDHGFHDLEEAESILGVPALGFIPRVPRRAVLGPQIYAAERPISAYAEAIRGVYTSITLSEFDRVPKRILVTSSLPGEGKTSLSISLARLMAAADRKVVLVDCDLRRRDVSRALGIPTEPGLTDHLSGRASLSDAMSRDPKSGAFVLPAGSHTQNPADVLGSEKMRDLLVALGTMFDLVIMDSAPVLAVSDTRSLCRFADKVVMAVRWQHTRKTAATPALRQITASGGDVVGVLLTLADTRRLPAHSASAYYFRQVQQYLTG
jgi:succinoglycan biosynthesis transport protein ExoP